MREDAFLAAFKAAVEARGGRFVALSGDDLVQVDFGQGAVDIFLDNLRRRVAIGQSVGDVVALVGQIFASPDHLPSGLNERLAGLRLMLERRDALASSNVVRTEVSREVALALAWTDPLEMLVQFVTTELLATWLLSEREAGAAARQQMDRLLVETPIEIHEVGRDSLLQLATRSIFKASLLAAPSLRRHVEPRIGWPVLAVAPCRDFVYLFPRGANDLLGRLGGVVAREFAESPYPLSPEVFSISDEGITAIGTFGTAER